MAILMACNRAVRFGARCPENAVAGGKCAEHQKSGTPRAPVPDVVLVKFTLPPSVASVAAQLFRDVPRMTDMVEKSHENLARAVGLQFKGKWRAEDKPGDSGIPVFRGDGNSVRDVSIAPLRSELERMGFVLANVHTFQKPDGKQVLVLGYHMWGEPVALRGDQQEFIGRSWTRAWGFCAVWANIPEMVASAGEVQFKYIVLEDRGDKLLIQVTKPRVDETAEVAKKEITESHLECLHTVNLGGQSNAAKTTLVYADGLWAAQ